jgi:serine/threonine-protein kinase
MGVVYAAVHLDTGAPRAVKVLSIRVVGQPDLEARLLHEAEVLSTLDSPCLVRVYEVGWLEDGRPFYVMDLLEGQTLRDACARGRLPVVYACGVVHQALEALHVCHRHKIVHRDVNPSNLFLRSDGSCVLLDFGLIKVLGATSRFSKPQVSTGEGYTLGTARYVPPEAGTSRKPDARFDVYAAGVVLAELLAGELPLAHLDSDAYLDAIEAGGFPLPEGLPAELRDVVALATARDPDERYASAAEFAAQLGWACRRAGVDLVGVRPIRPTLVPAPARPGLLARAAHVAFGALGTAAAFGLAWSRREAPAIAVAPEPRQLPAIACAAAAATVVLHSAKAGEDEPPPPAPAPSSLALRAAAPVAPSTRALVERRQLEAKLRSRQGTMDDAAEFKRLCRAAGDVEGERRAQEFMNAFSHGPR